MLTSQERAKLISLSHMLKDLVFLGKEGITDTVIDQVEDNLYAHELIKIKVNKNVPEEINIMAQKLADECNCEVVTVIGSKIVLYRLTDKPKFTHILKR